MEVILFWGLVVWAVLIAPGTWWIEKSAFERKHARKRVQVLNGLRLAVAAGILMVGWWIVPASALRAISALVAGSLIFLPGGWLLRVGGIEPKWELRALQDEAGELSNRYPTPPRPAEFVQPMERLVGRMKAIRAPEIAEIRDLLVADFADSIVGLHHFPDPGLRTIRVHQIECEIFGAEARRAELDPAEATFRWHLYRTFGDMIDAGAAREPEYLSRMRELIEELEQFRRPHTGRFIDALQVSARAWLVSQTSGQWAEGGALSLGPTIERAYREIWPRKAVFWGAELDDRDISALPTVMEARQIPGA